MLASGYVRDPILDSAGTPLSDEQAGAMNAARRIIALNEEEIFFYGNAVPGAADKVIDALYAAGWRFGGGE